jgi:hypothetical protein
MKISEVSRKHDTTELYNERARLRGNRVNGLKYTISESASGIHITREKHSEIELG